MARVFAFLDHPTSPAGRAVQALIYAIIFYSVGVMAIEFWWHDIYLNYEQLFKYGEYLTLGAFTLEYVLKVATAPQRLHYIARPFSVVDLLAILPGLMALLLPFALNTTQLRALRLLRVLRGARVLRVARLLRVKFFSKLLRFHNTVLQAIMPILAIFLVLKGVFWLLEALNIWSIESNLGELFSIIGFALGIILSQKVASTYAKFLQIEEQMVRLAGTLSTFATILEHTKPGSGGHVIYEWGRSFLRVFLNPRATMSDMTEPNRALYAALAACEAQPGELAMKYASVLETATFCFQSRDSRTPRPYDSLLQHATVTYLVLLTVFIPGWSGMLSVLVATYVLYGMYDLTQDLDTIIGGEFHLTSIDFSDLQRFAEGGNTQPPASAAESKHLVGAAST